MNNPIRIKAITIIVTLLAGCACSERTVPTAYRDVSQTRHVSDLTEANFFDNFESGSLINLRKVGPTSFTFQLQDRAIYGKQGSLMVWFYGICDLSGVKVHKNDALRMHIPGPTGLTNVRPVYSYDNEHWQYVPEGWGQREDGYYFDVPLKSGVSAVYFAAHYPYPAQRVSNRATELVKNRYVQACKVAGKTEHGRDILLLTITDPSIPNAGKRVALLSSGMHGGETASLWGLEGAIDFLISEEPEAQKLRRQAVFYIVPMSNVDAFALGLDRRQATGVNIYFDFVEFKSREARVLWDLLKKLRPSIWLDFHSWHLGKAEGLYGPDPKVVGKKRFAVLKKLIDAIDRYFPIIHQGADKLECPATQAMLQLDVLGFGPEFNMGIGADGRWKTIEDQKELGKKIMLGLLDFMQLAIR